MAETKLDLDLLALLLGEGRQPRKFTPTADAELVSRAADTGRELADRVRDRQLQVRKAFIRRESRDKPVPPSAALAASRSEVHLKTQLALLWVSSGKGVNPKYATLTQRDRRTLDGRANPDVPVVEDEADGRALLLETDPYVAEFRLSSYAKLFGLPSPKTAGAARVRRSLDELARGGLIWLDRTSGAAPRTQLRREDGTGGLYKLPGEKKVTIVEGTVRAAAEGKYLTLPAAFFTNGWIAALSARAIAAYLALLVQHDMEPDKPAFIAPSIRSDRFGMTEDSFLRGCAELVFYRLVLHQTAPVQRDWSTSRGRARHAFILVPTALGNDPTSYLKKGND